MKKDENKIIFQSFYLYDQKDRQAIIDNWNMDQDEDELYTEDQVAEFHDEDYENDFLENYKYSSLAGSRVRITGHLGLWDGQHEIYPLICNSLEEAMNKILNNDIEYTSIYEDRYGNLKVDAYHHDGVNTFMIKRYTDKGPRTMNYGKVIYGW